LRRFTYPALDSLRTEFDAFADAVEEKAAPPIPVEQMFDTVGAFRGDREVPGGIAAAADVAS
jgi:hypothetical protein